MQRGVKRAQCPRRVVRMKKVRKIRWHSVMTETLKTKGSNFVFDRGFNWKPVESSLFSSLFSILLTTLRG